MDLHLSSGKDLVVNVVTPQPMSEFLLEAVL